MEEINYVLQYDILETLYFPIWPYFLVFFGAVLIWVYRRFRRRLHLGYVNCKEEPKEIYSNPHFFKMLCNDRKFTVFVLHLIPGTIVLLGVLSALAITSRYYIVHDVMQNKMYYTLEGKVSNLVFRDYKRRTGGHFEIDNVRFRGEPRYIFNEKKSFLYEGKKLKIVYMDSCFSRKILQVYEIQKIGVKR
jgi:hypothetical protein